MVVSQPLATDGKPAEEPGQPHSFYLEPQWMEKTEAQSSQGIQANQFPSRGCACSKGQSVQGSCSEIRAGHHSYLTSECHDSEYPPHLVGPANPSHHLRQTLSFFTRSMLIHPLLHSLTHLSVSVPSEKETDWLRRAKALMFESPPRAEHNNASNPSFQMLR